MLIETLGTNFEQWNFNRNSNIQENVFESVVFKMVFTLPWPQYVNGFEGYSFENMAH